jgi:acetolactate synthase-1/2/3 large subunit
VQAEASPQDEKLSAVVQNWLPRFLANGLDALQVQQVLAGIERWDQWATAWAASAQQWEERAAAALEAGHPVTAGEHFQRAALTLQFAQFVLTEDLDARARIHGRQADLYRTAAPLLRPPAEPVSIPYDGITLPGYLRRPPDRPDPGLVILVPGLESTKEQLSTYEPYFLNRGMATLSFEGPGQGETWYHRAFSDSDYQDALAALLGFVGTLDEIDRRCIGVVGTSFGGYLALKSARAMPGLKCVVDIAGPFDLSGFDQLQPVIQTGFAHLVKAPDPAAAKTRVSDVTLAGALEGLDVPVLVVHGAQDTVIPPGEALRIVDALGARAELWLEPTGNHACNNLYAVMRPAVADWVAEQLTRARSERPAPSGKQIDDEETDVSDPRHAGDLLVGLLIDHGVDTVFGLPGGQTAAMYDAIDRRGGTIRHVGVRDERSAAYAADAYARLTGKVGVCDATVGPGTAKLPSGLGEALNSSIPLLAIVSELPSSTEARRYRGATSQGLDQETLLAPVTKWVATVRRQEDLAALVRRAFREATTGRPGPVALIFPQEVLDEAPRVAQPAPDPHAARFGSFPAVRAAPDADDVTSVVELLRRARRPLVLLGGGALASGVAGLVVPLAEAVGAAVATTFSGKGCIDERHPLAVGLLSTMGAASAARAAEEADVLLLVGTKAGSGSTLGWSLPRADQLVAQIDVDPAELGRDFAVQAFVLADARQALAAILTSLTGSGSGGGQDSSAKRTWARRVGEVTEDWRNLRDSERRSAASPIWPQRVMGELQSLIGPTDIVVADASLASGWVGAYLEQEAVGRRLLFPRGLAGLGWAVPAALGAAVACPGARVIAVMGDGALGYTVGELAAVMQHRLNVTLVVLNNSSYGWIRWYRRITFDRGWENDDFPATDYAAVARAYGLATERVEDAGDLAGALGRVLGGPGPGLVEVLSSVWDTPVAAHRQALGTGTAAGYGS